MVYGQTLTCGNEVIKLAFNTYLSLSLSETSQQFLDGNRLLWLVGVTKNGEP
jgi:hypothetical protein